MNQLNAILMRKPADLWHFPTPFGWRSIAIAIVALLVLGVSGADVRIDRAAILSGQGIAAGVGLAPESQVSRGFGTIVGRLFPPQLAEVTDVARIEGFDRNALPHFAHLEMRSVAVQSLDPVTLRMRTTHETHEILVQPFGYAIEVGRKLLETVEIALWGTILAMLIGAPLAFFGARTLSPSPVLVVVSRAIVSLLRAVPELISALFFVLAYGFGPIAGMLALALHAAGFLGKFYAEDIENADRGPQDALIAIGANRLKVLRYAILPQVLPQYVAYTLYVLDRNVRMATVIGLVGAGGIGQELKGRYDLYQYAYVGTILIAIFLLVFALDQLSSRLRRRWI